MIEKDRFNRVWKHLCQRFNRDPNPSEAVLYLQWLSPQMNTEAFEEAARHLWATREFFPRPIDFLEAARPSIEAEAQDQWKLCDRVMSGDREALARMSPAGQKTVMLMGGPAALRNTQLDEVHFRRQEFMRLFADAEEIHRRESQHQIGPGPEEARQLVGSHLQLVPGDES